MRVSYPRTAHLPWSPGASADDIRVSDLSGLAGREVVVTEKLDGENTTLYRDGLHARSLDSAHHPSRAWMKVLHGRIAQAIPAGWRVCGENVYARHSIAYDDLQSWFYGFSVWRGDRCLHWDEATRFLARLGIPVPPVLWRGVFDERALRALRLDSGRQEGFVVRVVEEFGLPEFAHRVAKWVRRGHVQTDQHWMLAPVVPNGRGPAAALWEVRSGATPGVASLLAAVSVGSTELVTDAAETAVADASTRLDLLERRGDARLAGVLATLFHTAHRPRLAPRLVAPLGMPLARRVADLVGLHGVLHRPFPDEERRAGLVRLSAAADLGVLHAVAAAVLTGHSTIDAATAGEQVDWSSLHAGEAGLLGEAPLLPLRTGLSHALPGNANGNANANGNGNGNANGVDARDRCWAEAREAYAQGRIAVAEEAAALTWRWRSGAFPRLVVMVGPSGSGKSSFAGKLAGVDEVISLDDLRQARGSRSDQRANDEVLRAGLDRLDASLAPERTVVWDATCLNRQQRSLVHAVARRRDALVTHAVLLIDEDTLSRRNASREHPVPPAVLAAQLGRFVPPYPGEAHRTWYLGPDGGVRDTAGALDSEDG